MQIQWTIRPDGTIQGALDEFEVIIQRGRRPNTFTYDLFGSGRLRNGGHNGTLERTITDATEDLRYNYERKMKRANPA